MKIDLKKTQVVNEGAPIPTKLGPFMGMFLKRHPLSLFVFTLFVLFEASWATANAYLLKLIVDGVIATGSKLDLLLAAILLPAILYATIQIIMNVLFTIYRYAHLQFFPKIKSDIAGTVHHYLTGHSYRYFSEQFSGSLAKKIFDLCMGVEAIIQILPTH